MKKKLLLVICVFLLLIFCWFFTRHAHKDAHLLSSTTVTSVEKPDLVGVIEKRRGNSDTNATFRASSPPDDTNYIHKVLADPQYDWKQPINFYGRVVDENGAVVVGADVHFTWNNISIKGTADADTTSDSNGFFSLTDKRGKRLYVDVGKSGYYSSGDARGAAFEYANPFDGLFHPDPNNPVLFHLRKKGVGVDLITSQRGIANDFQIHIPRDGTPIKVDFMQHKTGDSGQMQITENKPDFKNWKQATNWWFRMEIPDGGFVEENDEFPFTAPEAGYTNVVEFNFQKDQPDWALNLKKDYYIKFGNPPKFGLLHIQTGISYGGAILNYAINPNGSRNLEPQSR